MGGGRQPPGEAASSLLSGLSRVNSKGWRGLRIGGLRIEAGYLAPLVNSDPFDNPFRRPIRNLCET
eukprot:15455471-Alexandrium_andersonii.AAC.1